MSEPGNPFYPPQGVWQLPTRPMTLGQTLDRIFKLLRSHFKLFVAIGSVPLVGLAVLEGAYFAFFFKFLNPARPGGPANLSPQFSGLIVPVFLALWLAIMALYALFEAAASHATLSIEAGTHLRARDAWRHIWARAGRYLWLMVLRMLVASAPMLLALLVLLAGLFAAAFIGRGDMSHGALFVLVPFWILLFAAAAVYTVLAMIWLALAYPASLAEDLPAWKAVRRSCELTHGARGRIFLTLLALYAISMAGVMAVELAAFMLFALGALLITALHLNAAVGFICAGAGGLVLALVVLVLMAITSSAYAAALAILYRDQRRLELTPAIY